MNANWLNFSRLSRILLSPGRRALFLSLLICLYFFNVYYFFYYNVSNEIPVYVNEANDQQQKPSKFYPKPKYKDEQTSSGQKDQGYQDVFQDVVKPDQGQKDFVDRIVTKIKDQEVIDEAEKIFKEDPFVFRTFGKGYEDREGMEFVKNMMKHAWGSYENYAWGYDELKPISKTGRNWHGGYTIGATIIDALDTLWIMDMKEEFEKAKKYVFELDFNVPVTVSFFETTIRVVGGLLSAYDLSGDIGFVSKAKEIADRLLPAFNTPTGIPNGAVNLMSGQSQLLSWAGGAILSEYGSIQLEYPYLSDVTGDIKYRELSMKVIDCVSKLDKPYRGLFPLTINNKNGEWVPGIYSIGALGDSFYEYLLKCWIASDRKEEKFRTLYNISSEAILQHLIRRTSNGDMYLGAGNPGQVSDDMEHLTCFAGGMYALGAVTNPNKNWIDMFYIGGNLTETCYKMYSKQALGIGAERTRIASWTPSSNYYILRPEVIESIFYMWRITHNPIYRKYARNIAEALEKWCRVEGGYSGIRDVRQNPPMYNDNQESFFLAETLKYLYLIFTDDETISIKDYVFNTEAHPLSTEKRRKKFKIA